MSLTPHLALRSAPQVVLYLPKKLSGHKADLNGLLAQRVAFSFDSGQNLPIRALVSTSVL